ncbi:MAG: hypothetical protein SVY10_13015 [Thermodesulfobacteriota bacterium]|nr:hypothetical protein [Thermodesulfobacteriota bacterium]
MEIFREMYPSFTINDTLNERKMFEKFITIARQIPDIGAKMRVIHSALCPCSRNITASTKHTKPMIAIIPKNISLAPISLSPNVGKNPSNCAVSQFTGSWLPYLVSERKLDSVHPEMRIFVQDQGMREK